MQIRPSQSIIQRFFQGIRSSQPINRSVLHCTGVLALCSEPQGGGEARTELASASRRAHARHCVARRTTVLGLQYVLELQY